MHALCEKLAVLHHREFGKLRRLTREFVVNEQVIGFRGCYPDSHNWRCVSAVRALCESAPNDLVRRESPLFTAF